MWAIEISEATPNDLIMLVKEMLMYSLPEMLHKEQSYHTGKRNVYVISRPSQQGPEQHNNRIIHQVALIFEHKEFLQNEANSPKAGMARDSLGHKTEKRNEPNISCLGHINSF